MTSSTLLHKATNYCLYGRKDRRARDFRMNFRLKNTRLEILRLGFGRVLFILSYNFIRALSGKFGKDPIFIY